MDNKLKIRILDAGYYRIEGFGTWAQVAHWPCSADELLEGTFNHLWHRDFLTACRMARDAIIYADGSMCIPEDKPFPIAGEPFASRG